jgi:hypothetical protein
MNTLQLIALCFTIGTTVVGFSWWLSRHLTKIEGWFELNDESHDRIEKDVVEVKEQISEFVVDQRECREKLVRIDTQVDTLCGNGNGDE